MRGTLNDQSLIYLQIAQILEDHVLREIYREEEQVPSTNELSRSFNINPATAAKGVNMLVDEGILYKKRGIGMFVAKGAKEKILFRRREAFLQVKLQELLQEAQSLGISREELAVMLKGEK